jgi:hypothetical protein
MRVKLKGVHEVHSKGKTYYYAWRGGPLLAGVPGSPEFIASYYAAYRNRREPDATLFQSVIAAYLASTEFSVLRQRTQSDYLKQISKIETAFGDLPLDALDDPRVTRDLLDWRQNGVEPASSRLRLDGPNAIDLVGEGARTHIVPASRPRCAPLSWRPSGEGLERGTHRGIYGCRAADTTAGARARAGNGTAAG